MAEEVNNDEVAEPTDGNAATATAPAKTPAPARKEPVLLPPYRVLLHNDAVNTFDDVIKAIVQLTSLPPQKATLCTIEAHETGVSLLLITHRERAELYAEQFMSLKLIVTIEPAL